nr:immunoglobulin heavy chain junction region [Macaca mulatta]MOV49266.1 immunoglobulin heavy chain junction region [Macaca mulatta]MOV49471.1 immunoglobulin heavy chain junction region [Macaca mulatta]MOV49584.1 immunoglobulin heavy chain junction region [Macaca mulatta]MOV50010.1 immunoglobulin heavy chain junction region [Macaca mulatta]
CASEQLQLGFDNW